MTEPRRVRLDEKGLPVRKEDAEPERAERRQAEDVVDCDCPRLDPEDWDRVESDWSDIAFVKSTTNAVLGVPVGYDTARAELRKKADAIGATVPNDAMLLNGSGKFRRPIMLEVEGAPEKAKDLVRPGGVAYTRLFEAPWGQLPKVAEETRKDARERYGREPDDLWVWYLTCRDCSRVRNFETLIVAHYRGTSGQR